MTDDIGYQQYTCCYCNNL